METVGIVEWSLDSRVDSAYVEFGRDPEHWEYRAPVDLDQPKRTLLLGMKPRTTYYFQIVAMSDGAAQKSGVHSLETGYLPNGLPVVELQDFDERALYGGFTVNCSGAAAGYSSDATAAKSWAFILDRDGEYVWAYDLSRTPVAACSRARLSFDAASVWVGNFSNLTRDGALLRVGLDGLGPEEIYSLPARHHDFVVIPGEKVLYIEQANGGGYDDDGSEGPDVIKELDPATGDTREVYQQATDFAAQIAEAGGAHTNQIDYVPFLDAISFSMRNSSTIAVVSYPEGELTAVFAGPTRELGLSWDVQHGHEVREDTLLVFNNNGRDGGASILEYEYDLVRGTATEILEYSSGNSSLALGDVQRLPNGNTFVTYSSTGVFHEIDAEGGLLREMRTGAVGYSEHRRSLYGPPPPFEPPH